MPQSLSALLSPNTRAWQTIGRVDEVNPPRVLLGKLEPILLVGLEKVLADDGVDVVGHALTPTAIVTEARRLQPDVVVLNLDSVAGETLLGQRIQDVAPRAKVILWARDETVMEVLDPSSRAPRLVPIDAGDDLRIELTNSRHPILQEDE